MSNEIKKALCEGEINLGPVIVKCAVLENKQRVISQREVVKAITGHAKGGLDRYLQPQNLQPYIPEKFKSQSLDQATLKYISLNGKTGQCFSATDIVDFLDMYLQARKDGALLSNQTHLADQAEMIMRSLAKTGIIALIDEATGYEKIKETGELIKFFKEAMVREMASDKIREFEKRGLFDGLYKMYNIPRKKDKQWQHPPFFGNFFIKYIYKPLDVIITDGKVQTKGIMHKLLQQQKNLHSGSTLYQFITEIGEPQFFEHLSIISSFMIIANNKRQFDILFEKKFGTSMQQSLFPDIELNDFFGLEEKIIKKTKQKQQQDNPTSAQFIKNIEKDGVELNANNEFEANIKKIIKHKV
jgi:hypothetical protein